MRKFYLATILLLALYSCGSRKTVYDKGISENTVEKLAKEYAASPADTAIENQLTFAYQTILSQYESAIASLQYAGNLNDKERLLNAYSRLQIFYDKVRSYPRADNLLRPASVRTEIEKTKLELVTAYYDNAQHLMEDNHWKSSRQAYQALTKVNSWMPDYKDTRQLLREARDNSIINAVILPLRSEGFFYGSNFLGNFNNGPRLSELLVRDLGGNYNSNNAYRVYNPWEIRRQDNGPDWSVDPVWTMLRLDNPRMNRTERRVEKQEQIGKDTANKPIYKTLVAFLTITEANYNASGRLEIRITDEKNRENIARNSWMETHNLRLRWATYKGDAGALSNADWELINAPRNQRIDEAYMESRLLQKMYPNMLNWLRNRLSY